MRISSPGSISLKALMYIPSVLFWWDDVPAASPLVPCIFAFAKCGVRLSLQNCARPYPSLGVRKPSIM